MKKRISLILIIASIWIILDVFNAGAAVTAFILTGAIPGTNLAISASAMLMLYALIAGFAISRLVRTPTRQPLRSAN